VTGVCVPLLLVGRGDGDPGEPWIFAALVCANLRRRLIVERVKGRLVEREACHMLRVTRQSRDSNQF